MKTLKPHIRKLAGSWVANYRAVTFWSPYADNTPRGAYRCWSTYCEWYYPMSGSPKTPSRL